jgi:hypothetical protein
MERAIGISVTRWSHTATAGPVQSSRRRAEDMIVTRRSRLMLKVDQAQTFAREKVGSVFIIYSERKINVHQTYNSKEAIYADCFLFNIIALKARGMTMRRC